METPFKVYIYETQGEYKTGMGVFAYGIELKGTKKGKGKVIGEFVCDKITDISVVVRNCNEDYNHVYHNDECKGSCLTWKELQKYGNGKPLYGWHISTLKIYDKPKELSEFEFPKDNIHLGYRKRNQYFKGITRPPQSWCYVEQ